ncbi:NADH-ubiquinone oxidoreductase 12 kDa subunit mitochondrial precursor [Ascobolus immersus RN42]|uniref:NADH-ubiquinone oxidoreductase 12 kDa subunit mitochondrial n=1 Tax=Ascobolus immersus RN42 TaxID=1160509 RepID=A0A3N4HU74_ASCIM|nr:NADH-ubiquinone oxidoreductase 12 kDa subunit mitochondrial precursor [Ascobolus immersus RN42]
MPNLTPESEAFLAKKPKVPPTFDGVDFDDQAAYKAAQDAIIREQWVGVMKARIVRQELEKCYNREGVNHQVNCRNWRDLYLKLLKEGKVTGTIFPQQNYIPEDSKYAAYVKK